MEQERGVKMAKGNRTHKQASEMAKKMLHGIVTGATGKTKTQKIADAKEL